MSSPHHDANIHFHHSHSCSIGSRLGGFESSEVIFMFEELLWDDVRFASPARNIHTNQVFSHRAAAHWTASLLWTIVSEPWRRLWSNPSTSEQACPVQSFQWAFLQGSMCKWHEAATVLQAVLQHECHRANLDITLEVFALCFLSAALMISGYCGPIKQCGRVISTEHFTDSKIEA